MAGALQKAGAFTTPITHCIMSAHPLMYQRQIRFNSFLEIKNIFRRKRAHKFRVFLYTQSLHRKAHSVTSGGNLDFRDDGPLRIPKVSR
jgi:hypothetical protein